MPSVKAIDGRAVPRLHQAGVVLVEGALSVGSMVSWFDHGSGIIIITACGSERPASTSSSSALSNIAESLPLGVDDREGSSHVVAEQVGRRTAPRGRASS